MMGLASRTLAGRVGASRIRCRIPCTFNSAPSSRFLRQNLTITGSRRIRPLRLAYQGLPLKSAGPTEYPKSSRRAAPRYLLC